MPDLEQALISAVAARRAALTTPRDAKVELLLAVAAITITIVIGYGALQMITGLA